jgi:hypothetical protein
MCLYNVGLQGVMGLQSAMVMPIPAMVHTQAPKCNGPTGQSVIVFINLPNSDAMQAYFNSQVFSTAFMTKQYIVLV